MPYQANSDAAGGATASAFGPTAACTYFFLPFSPTASNARFMDFSPADIAPPGAGRSLTSAVASGRKIRRHSLEGFLRGAADLSWLT